MPEQHNAWPSMGRRDADATVGVRNLVRTPNGKNDRQFFKYTSRLRPKDPASLISYITSKCLSPIYRLLRYISLFHSFASHLPIGTPGCTRPRERTPAPAIHRTSPGSETGICLIMNRRGTAYGNMIGRSSMIYKLMNRRPVTYSGR